MADVKQSNPKAFSELELKLKQLESMQTKVGWFESARYENGTPVAYVAQIQEKGWGPIPPRPFMKPAEIKNKEKWQKTAEFSARKIVEGSMSAKDGMTLLGEVAQGDIIAAITAVTAPPLSPITLMARKFREMGKKVTGATIGMFARKVKEGKVKASDLSNNTKPLNDTGVMIATVTNITESTQ